MEKVLDTITKNLPSQMSLKHWQVGPMQGDFETNNDLRASELQATSEYVTMDDEQVAVATAAAAAAMAMEHQHQQRRRSSQERRFSQDRLRAFAAGIPQRPEIQQVQQAIQDIRQRPKVQQVEQAIQGIREQVPVVVQNIKQRTPEVIQEIRDKSPEVLQSWRSVVQEIRRAVYRIDGDDGVPPEYDCDATGRQISRTAEYNDSLNEGEEQREQPPPNSPFYNAPGRRIRRRWNQFCEERQLHQHRASGKGNNDAEYYVNFADGNAQEAVKRATTTTSATNHSTKLAPGLLLENTGYADMDACVSQQQFMSAKRSGAGAGAAAPTPATQQLTTQSSKEEAQSSLHSTASFEWGAVTNHTNTRSRSTDEEEKKEEYDDVTPEVVLKSGERLVDEAPIVGKVEKPEGDEETQSASEDDSEIDELEASPKDGSNEGTESTLQSEDPVIAGTSKRETGPHASAVSEGSNQESNSGNTTQLHSTSKFQWGAATSASASSSSSCSTVEPPRVQ